MVYYESVIKKINPEIKNINEGRDLDMKYDQVLNQIQNGEINSQEAYELLYPTPKLKKVGKRAHFIKMKVTIPEEGKGLNTFLRILFALPIPLVFARFGLRIASRYVDNEDVDFNMIRDIIKYSKNTVVNVDTDDAKVDIRII